MSKSNDSLLSDMKKAKGLGSSHSGTHHWMLHRVTALVNIPLIFWVVYSMFQLKGASYAEFTAWLSSPISAVLAIIFVINSFLHAKLGLEEIYTDYINNKRLRLVKTIGTKLFFTGLGIAVIFTILKVAFTAGV